MKITMTVEEFVRLQACIDYLKMAGQDLGGQNKVLLYALDAEKILGDIETTQEATDDV